MLGLNLATGDYEIMRDNALINLTGLEGHCMPVDLNIEHHIKFLKVCLSLLRHVVDQYYIVQYCFFQPKVSIQNGITLVTYLQLSCKMSRNRSDMHLASHITV